MPVVARVKKQRKPILVVTADGLHDVPYEVTQAASAMLRVFVRNRARALKLQEKRDQNAIAALLHFIDEQEKSVRDVVKNVAADGRFKVDRRRRRIGVAAKPDAGNADAGAGGGPQ